MYNIDLANVKSIVADIVAKHNVENVAGRHHRGHHRFSGRQHP